MRSGGYIIWPSAAPNSWVDRDIFKAVATQFVRLIANLTPPQGELSFQLKATNARPNAAVTLVAKINSITYDQPNYVIRLYIEGSKVNPDNATLF